MNRASTPDADTADRVRGAVQAALDRKAQDLRVLNLGPVSDFTDYFLICSGTSERQVQAISEAGGLNELGHSRRIKLTRKGPNGVGTYDVSLKAITEGREPDILLQPGDLIFVPMAPI